MVWRWPRNLLETAVAANSSNIRLLRFAPHPNSGHPVPFQAYWDEMIAMRHFHHAFWSHNNARFHAFMAHSDESCGRAEREYLTLHKDAFHAYHRACWQGTWRAILVGYRELFREGRAVLSLSLKSDPVT